MDQLSQLVPYLLVYKYVGIFLLNYLTSAIVPLPGGAILLVIGTLTHKGYFNIFLSFIIALIATVLGDFSAYFFMRLFGTKERLARYRTSRAFRIVERYIATHPFSTIIISRFIGFSTTAANGVSGFLKMPLRTFLLADIIGNALCVAAYLAIGYGVGNLWSQANLLSLIGIMVVLFAVVYALAMIPFYLLRDSAQPNPSR